jgi:hypothetical protein
VRYNGPPAQPVTVTSSDGVTRVVPASAFKRTPEQQAASKAKALSERRRRREARLREIGPAVRYAYRHRRKAMTVYEICSRFQISQPELREILSRPPSKGELARLRDSR